MANIYEYLDSMIEKGYDRVDDGGNFISSGKISKIGFKSYQRDVKEGQLNPVETPYSEYLEMIMGEYAETADLQIIIREYLESEDSEG